MAATNPSRSAVALSGTWGGIQARFSVEADGARFEADCADGFVKGPIRLDAQGRFSALGTFSVAAGGPERADAPRPRADTRFNGVVSGNGLTLTIKPARGTPLVFELRKGLRPKIVRCL